MAYRHCYVTHSTWPSVTSCSYSLSSATTGRASSFRANLAALQVLDYTIGYNSRCKDQSEHYTLLSSLLLWTLQAGGFEQNATLYSMAIRIHISVSCPDFKPWLKYPIVLNTSFGTITAEVQATQSAVEAIKKSGTTPE